MPQFLLNLDVDDIERAVRFYTRAFGLSVGRRFDADFVELLGAQAPLYLLNKAANTTPFAAPANAPFATSSARRDYHRHWTPIHLDWVVDDIALAVERAVAAGAQVEEPITQHAYGKLALLSDPFGHGFCLLQFQGKGYDELAG
jgi:predicted enzyme related to lactoylglutathione lyase